MRTIAIINQKGGCGKTTTAINVAAAFAQSEKRVLLIDLDPQAHATIGLGSDPDSFHRTVYDAFVHPDRPLSDAIVRTDVVRLDLVPCNVLLASVEVELAGVPGKELLLGRALRSARDSYDLCVIDCPPSLGILTLNALVSSTDIIVPVQVHYYALEGLKRLLETIRIIRDRFHPFSAENINLLLTFVDERTTFSRQIQQQMRNKFGGLVFDTVIHRNVRLAEAPSAGMPVLTYAPHSRGALDFRTLASEILNGASKPLGEPVAEGIRRGIQKQVDAIFDGVWIPKDKPTRHKLGQDTIETT